MPVLEIQGNQAVIVSITVMLCYELEPTGVTRRKAKWLVMSRLAFLFYLAIAGKASLESFILQPIRENICISLAANDIIIIYLCQNITES